ncbi:MAG: maltodextrin phosphorylase [Peptococcaceae bacterium BICA1-8]|nr:MAG: maltodextrin phosphorylase [Peptococcaceae bacterium BICA1-8]
MVTDKETFIHEYCEKFIEIQGKIYTEGTAWEQYRTLVLLLRDKISQDSVTTNNAYTENMEKQVYYFSMEFMIGRLLSYYLMNLGLQEKVREGLKELGISLETLIQQERDAGLGNGGLGRLAACFLDSMAFLGVPGHGNGIRYKYGLFQQKLIDGSQVELADNWLKDSYPWETRRAEKSVIVRFKGNIRTEMIDGKLKFIHENEESVLAVPYDIPIVSYDSNENINNLRLWSAEPVVENFDFASFNRGEFSKAVSYKAEVEAISCILYPDDSSQAGRELRLKQEYFFVAAGLGAIVRRYKKKYDSIHGIAKKIAVHINDTHPTLCIPELMRILIDDEDLGWEEAWNITVNIISFTNHTILPEALEKWPIEMLKSLLPRIYLIVEEIDHRYREEIRRKYPGNTEIEHPTSVIHDGQIWMANLAVIGSYSVNGVASLHTKILKKEVFRHFNLVYPYKFNNKTNGVSHRRFLLNANPDLSNLITNAIGEEWKKTATKLEGLLAYREDAAFLEELALVKRRNKENLAKHILESQGIAVDPSSVFDVHVKRIHAYKRQLLNVLKIMDCYNRIKENQDTILPPQTFIFAGKAAPGYYYAKNVIKLINTVADKINHDPTVNNRMKVVFLENFNVSLAEKIYPAADISEQISTASREASGTGNMKFIMNGAVTLGTLDGANVEILKEVGKENIMIFGLSAEEVLEYYRQGGYKSWDEYHKYPRLKRVIDQLINNFFPGAGGEFQEIYDSLLREKDEFFVLKDFCPYIQAYQNLNQLYTNGQKWNQMSLVNIARSGFFSSDRSILEYAEKIWRVTINK